ncbi:MAG: hypothetical protein ABTQ29_04970, partial [Siculibacillus sp.]
AYDAARAVRPAGAAPIAAPAPQAAPSVLRGPTEEAEPETTGSIPRPAAKAEEGWFSSTASSMRGIGGALGLW